MRLGLMAALLCAAFISGCVSMPDMEGGGIPLAKSGWQMTGGADFDKQVWFVMFWKPWGEREKAASKNIVP